MGRRTETVGKSATRSVGAPSATWADANEKTTTVGRFSGEAEKKGNGKKEEESYRSGMACE